MNTIEFNKHDVDIIINGMWQKYEVNLHKATTSPSTVSPASPKSRPFLKPT
jgi:hypothetical protein